MDGEWLLTETEETAFGKREYTEESVREKVKKMQMELEQQQKLVADAAKSFQRC